VGPGFGDPARSTALLGRVLPRVDTSVVLDGVASAYLADRGDELTHLRDRLVLTVNPSELARSTGATDGDAQEDPLRLARELAGRYGVVVLCGGQSKYVAEPGGASWRVEGGGPGLGVSGSGDVQAGIVAGLVARNADPVQAAVWAAYLHARSGERLAAEAGMVGYLARQLPAQVTAVLSELG
jgi:NAD(P)H-hydrate repair Nnr-like enzyme with NAD(P)H-hydrate dehydratase domain